MSLWLRQVKMSVQSAGLFADSMTSYNFVFVLEKDGGKARGLSGVFIDLWVQ